MSSVPTPVSPYIDSPWTHVYTWAVALYIAHCRVVQRNRKQQISWDKAQRQWKVEDA